ncbi:hypothetical protein E3U23_12530 [Erythrobacter litoralis]|uniref:hypothetical protein n=1 Tax=Erythrobacter litoralis TaxID=39960 RepID=UPI0024358E35|nr:hypothetical protein [Erythrobacter litoralis]MDG6080014.1 hypothetical protein [Erythrobacter litoralis]
MWHTILKIRLLFGLVPALAVVLWAGIDSGETYYEKSPEEIRRAIASAYLPVHILGDTVKRSRVTQPADGTVVTALLDENDVELMRFVTTVTPDDTGATVKTDVVQPEGKHAERAHKAMKEQTFAMSLLEVLAEEHVAAAIEGRPFDMLAFNPTAKALAGPMGMAQDFDEINRLAAEDAAYMQDEAFREQYGDDWGTTTPSKRDGWGTEKAAKTDGWGD